MHLNFIFHISWSILSKFILVNMSQSLFVDSWCFLPFMRTASSLHNVNNSDLEHDASLASNNDFAGFNPFMQRQRSNNVPPIHPSSSRTLSLRKIQMDQLTDTLLQLGEKYVMDNKILHVSNIDFSSSEYLIQMKQVLNQNEGLLLEPILGGSDVSLDVDSIYTRDMNTVQRFDEYDRVMKLRMSKAQNMAVQLVLWAMISYVDSRRTIYC
jgi:hypothetical protein